jgi:hypothetical protein
VELIDISLILSTLSIWKPRMLERNKFAEQMRLKEGAAEGIGGGRTDKTIEERLFLETQYKHRYLYTYDHSTYEHTHAHTTPISIFKKLSRLNLEIYEIGHQECLTVDRNVASH